MAVEVYKRDGSPFWWAKVPVLDASGKVATYERFSTKRTAKAEARSVAQQAIKKSLDRSQLGHRVSETIHAVTQRYLDECESQGKASVRDYKSTIKRLFEGTVNSNSALTKTALMEELTTPLIKRIVSQRLREGLKPATINNELAFLSAAYVKAKEEYEVAVDQGVKFEKLQTEHKLRYLMGDEEARLLRELNPERAIFGIGDLNSRNPTLQRKLEDQFDLTVFLLDTGARYSEVATIMWSAVDVFTWKTCNLYRSKVGNEGNLYLTDRLRAVLQARYDRRNNSPYIFPSPTDATSPRGYATKGIRNAIGRAELNEPHLVKRYGKFTPHCLRHTFASKLAQNGVSLFTISKLLGHSSTQMTQRYAHLCTDTAAENAASILNQLKT
jgi:integrase